MIEQELAEARVSFCKSGFNPDCLVKQTARPFEILVQRCNSGFGEQQAWMIWFLLLKLLYETQVRVQKVVLNERENIIRRNSPLIN